MVLCFKCLLFCLLLECSSYIQPPCSIIQVRKPRILLLDEATSALDAESEALVQEAIDHMLERGRETEGGMTVLIVAHRLSTVRNADVIFVVKDGCVVEKGKHDDLILDPNGAYSSLIRRQMKAQQKLEEG